jgi:hypothetical protein
LLTRRRLENLVTRFLESSSQANNTSRPECSPLTKQPTWLQLLHEDDVIICDSSIIEHEEAVLLLLKSRRSTLRGLVFQIDQLTH